MHVIEVNTLIKYLKYASYSLFSIAFVIISFLLVIRYKNRFTIEEFSTPKKREPPRSKRDKKEYEYYNPGRREGGDWNYGDDAGFYYSETYTDYKKASDSVKKPKVRKIRVEKNHVPETIEEAPSRRRVVRKKSKGQEVAEKKRELQEIDETPVVEPEASETPVVESGIEEAIEDEAEKSIDDVKKEIKEEFTEEKNVETTDEDEIMSKALDKFFN